MNKQELLESLKDSIRILDEIAHDANNVSSELDGIKNEMFGANYIDINHFKERLQTTDLYTDALKDFIDNYLRFG